MDFAAARHHREQRQWDELAKALGEAAREGKTTDSDAANREQS
jgi:hypothetical protein